MGLAASQARLLSITSRMADNELRSQLINNAKMRLTTDSARVSDEYIDALNRTRLMFTNFDPEGNELYHGLNFTTLTAYSSYNNQYGIVNNSGEIIVSAADANNFRTASGDLEKFLELYGLKNTTDYFEALKTSQEFNGMYENYVTSGMKGVGYYDKNGQWQSFDVTPDELQAMWEAEIDNKGVHHYGRENSIRSLEYGDYEILAADYAQKRSAYKTALKESMKDYFKGDSDVIKGDQFIVNPNHYHSPLDNIGEGRYDEYYSAVLAYCDGNQKEYNFDDLMDAFKKFANKIGFDSGMNIKEGNSGMLLQQNELPEVDQGTGVNRPLEAILKEQINIIDYANRQQTRTVNYYDPNATIYYFKFEKDSDGNWKTDGNLLGGGEKGSLTTPGDTVYRGFGEDQPAKYTPGGTGGTEVYKLSEPMPASTSDVEYRTAYEYRDTDGSIKYTYPGATDWQDAQTKNVKPCTGPAIYEQEEAYTKQDRDDALRYMWETLRNTYLANVSERYFVKPPKCPRVEEALEKYKDAAARLADFIYGEGNGTPIVDEIWNNDGYFFNLDMLDYLDDPSWVLSQNTEVPGFTEDGAPSTSVKDYYSIDTTHFNPFYLRYPTTTLTSEDPPVSSLGKEGAEYHISYQAVKDVFLLDCMMEHYGEPVYTWIDQEDKNQDGQAKATWYTNLFHRMEKGYTTIGEGLTNSEEWLKFAFESGLVLMEQVNKSSEWVSTMYSNCSAITESTVDVDITLAEAKYNREMAKIQAKDKKYDIELKNIDTEHEALKQEYESIKKVMKGNIERNYKMFQSA